MLFSKSKFPALAAIAGKKAEEVTAEEIAAVQAELSEAGIHAIVVIGASAFASFEASAADLATAQASVESLTAQLTAAEAALTTAHAEAATATESLTAMTAERDQYKATAQAYGKQPGATPTAAVKEGTDQLEEVAQSLSIHPRPRQTEKVTKY